MCNKKSNQVEIFPCFLLWDAGDFRDAFQETPTAVVYMFCECRLHPSHCRTLVTLLRGCAEKAAAGVLWCGRWAVRPGSKPRPLPERNNVILMSDNAFNLILGYFSNRSCIIE